jgi:hypothetical protein
LISRLNPSVPILPPRDLSDEAQTDVAIRLRGKRRQPKPQINPAAQADAEYACHAWTQATAKRPTPRETFSLTALYVLTMASVVVAQAVYTASIH